MNTSIQNIEVNGIVQPSDDSSSSESKLCGSRHGPVSHRLMIWLAGLVCLLLATSAVRADRVPANCSGSGLGISLFTSIPDVHVGDTLFYSINVFNGIPNSGRIVCDATGIQAFIVTPDGKTNVVALVRTTLHQGEADFYPDVVSYVVRAQDIQPDGTLLATARDIGIIHQNDTDSIGGGFQGLNTQVNLPCIQIAVQCLGNVGENGPITFTGTVTNCGNNTLVNVKVTNFVNGAQFQVAFITNLARGQVASFSGSWVPSNPCVPSTATFTALGTDEFTATPRVVTSSASTTCSEILTSGIRVTKSCPVGPVAPGQLLTFSGSVSNTGNVTLTNIVVLNDQPASNTPVFTLASLAPGAVANFTGSYLAPTNCSVTDTLTARASSICGVGVTNTASATCPILTTPQITITAVCPATPVLPGGSLTYSGTVRNTGDVTLTNVVVISDRPAANTTVFTAATLAPGASANFTGTFTAPTNGCSIITTLSGTGRSVCTPTTATNTVSITCNITTAPAIAVTLACPAVSASGGGSITYSGTVRNSGNVALNNVFVVINQPTANTPVIGPITLAPGAIANFTATFTAPLDACTVSSTATATGNDACAGTPVSNSASAACPLTTTPRIVVTQLCPVTPAFPGGLTIFSGTVSNAGNITLTNVAVVNSLSGTTSLSGGASSGATTATFVRSDTATQGTWTTTYGFNGYNVIGNSTNYPSYAQVTPNGKLDFTWADPTSDIRALQKVASTDRIAAAWYAPDTFSVTLNLTDGLKHRVALYLLDWDTNARAQTIDILDTVSGVVLNSQTVSGFNGGIYLVWELSGNVTIRFTRLSGNNAVLMGMFFDSSPNATSTSVTLAPGAVASFTGSYFTPTNCSSTSTSTATGRSICGIAVTNTVSATCPILTTPAIKVTQTCPVTPVVPGGILTYSGTVSNAGNITLTNIIVVDNRPAANTVVFTLATLAPGATANFTGSYVTHPDCCVDSSTLKASGQGCAGVTVSDTVTRSCTLLTLPRIVVTKLCAPGVLRPGDLLTYSGTVSNAGNITLINVIVVDNQPANNTPVIGPITLAPGESVNYYGSYIVPPDFCGTDTVTASGLDLCTLLPVVNSATTTCPITTTPRITVTKKCPLLPTPRGGLYTFSGSVSNSGNVTLVNVFVVDNQLTNNTPVIGPITLAPGASVNFTGSYLAPVDCCELLDTVTARGQDRCSGSNVTATASAVCPLLSTPGIAVVQNCPAAPISVGSIYTYSGYVTNTGDVVLTNVFVYGPQGTNNPVLGPIELAPGESEVYSGSYTVPLDTCSVSVTASGRDTCGGNPVTNSSSCPVSTAPAIFVTENCPPGPVTAGSTVAFGGLVSNIGNVTLTNIFVFSGQPNNTQVLGPITLAPGASAPYSGSYIATGGSNPTTNSTIVTNNSTVITTNNNVTVTTNAATATSFGTINSVSQTVVDRFSMGTNFSGLTYAGEDHGYGATELYAMRKDTTGMSFFDTIIPSTATTTDRFPATTRNFDSLAYAAPDLGFGPLQFYYLSHDNAGVSTFGTITPGGAVGVVTDRFVVGNNFDALTFSATDLGYGVNLFYYVRHDATGLSTFGTINPALPGTITDRFTVGTNVDSLVFTDLIAPGYGPNRFYYVRHDANGVSTFGTIFITSLTTGAVTDRFLVGTNATELTFTATDVGFGANLFYFLRGRNPSVTTNTVTTFTTNTVTTFTTNSVVTFTPTNTVTAIGRDICQNRTVAAAANCTGPVVPASRGAVISRPTISNGVVSISFSTENGTSYTLQYKNRLNDPIWTNLQTVAGTGGTVTLTDSTAAGQPTRFYRVVSTP